MSNSTAEVNVPVFDGKNFNSWKFRIKTILEGRDLVAALEEEPGGKNKEKLEEWKHKNRKAKAVIVSGLSDARLRGE